MAIFTCTCIDEKADKMHGKSKRVFNQSQKDKTLYRCTTCSRTVNHGTREVVETKK